MGEPWMPREWVQALERSVVPDGPRVAAPYWPIWSSPLREQSTFTLPDYRDGAGARLLPACQQGCASRPPQLQQYLPRL